MKRTRPYLPYMWLPRSRVRDIKYALIRLGNKVRFFPGDVAIGLRNLIQYLPLIWRHRDWDWCYPAAMLGEMLQSMSKSTAGWHVMSAERTARQTAICAELLRRLLADDYVENACQFVHGRRVYEIADRQQRSDREYLGRMLGKHLNTWWD